MSNNELLVINSLAKNKDIGTVLSADVDDLFVSYGDVWGGIKEYYKSYRTVPDLSVLQDKYGKEDLKDVPVAAETAYYLDSLRDEFLSNQLELLLEKAAGSLEKNGAAKTLDVLQRKAANLNKYTNKIRDLDVTDYEEALNHFLSVQKKVEEMGGSPGIKTGFKAIDTAYPTGMSPGHLISVIGWPSRAKTWLCSLLAIRAWDQGFKPMVISLEMGPENMRDRIYTMMGEGKYSMNDFNLGNINTDDFRLWSKKKFKDKQDFIVISPEGMSDVTPNVVQGKIDQHKPDICILDYHQLFTDNGKNSNPVQRGTALSREFKLLATRNQIPIIDITAATAEQTSDRDQPPTMAQVAWSKAIEYDADLAFSVHRFDDSGLIDVTGRKNRHGSLWSMMLEWDLGRGIVKEQY